GFRIELGEIEAALNRHAGVRASAVVLREDTPGAARLVAYVVLEPGDAAGAAAAAASVVLRQWLQPQLPDYMLPAAYVVIAQLPLTAHGKLDRKALPAPDSARPDLAKAYVAPRTELEHYLVDIWCDILGLKQVGVYDNFFELGGDSLQAAVLANRVQEDLSVGAHVRSIFFAPTVADLSMYFNEYFPDTVAEKFGATSPHSLKAKLIETIEPADQSATVDAAKIALIKQLVPPLLPRVEEATTAPRHPAVFILSPPRSGSTLLRVMLAGHPKLFAPPELELLNFNTLQERREAFSGIYEPVLEGTIRTLMEIHGYDVDTATGLMGEYERQNLSTRQFYALMQDWIGERLLVDKTPAYSMDIDVLRRAEAEFANARYIHLVRHPYATIYSFVEAQLHEYFFRHPHPFAVRELAELIWTVSHQHVLEFRREIPAERYHRVMYEDLVSQPRAAMEEVCQFLGIEFHPAMVKPYEGKRMTDGIRPMSQMVGDLKFYLRNEIDGKAAERWKRFHANDFLGEISWQIAETLGYVRQAATEDGMHDAAPVTQAKLPALRPIPRDGMLALSFGQQRLWFLDQMEPGSPLYNIPAALRLSGALNRAALEQSLNTIVQRHEILRTSFATVDGQPVQQITPVLSLALPVTDLRDVPPAAREAEVQRLIAAEARRPFDLARGPLLRIRLFQLDEQDHVFCMTLHHIAADGWSSGVLVREIAALYPAFATGRPSPLPPLAIQYADYAQWQREWLQSEMLNKQLAYWKRQLYDSPPLLELPTDRPRPAVLTLQGVRQTFALPVDLTDQLRALSQQSGATLFMTLTAAFQTLLARYSGQDDICIGTPVANRARAEIEPLIGFFVNTLVLRTDLSGDPSFYELLARVQRVAEEAYANADIPFEMLVDELQPERNLSHTPLFQVMIALNKGHLQKLELPDLLMRPLPVDSGTAKFDLTLALVERTDGLYGALEYNIDLFDAVTIARMIEHFQILLAGIAANPNQPLSALPLLTEAERRQLLVEWNATSVYYPQDKCAHQLFEAQAEQHPDALAVVGGATQLTFDELNARANQLAHYLGQLGVGPDRLVGLCVERSPEMIVGALGVLKAGGAYVPLDPDYPAERIAFMLQDAQPVALLAADATAPRLRASAPPRLINLDADWPTIAQQPATNPDSGVTAENLAYVIYT
ncbi:MAG: condensation domain-containing protein, partial [Chloroflexales bacterium]|nr:condensation domain-containing protein [Chloroflexales bacterium]